MQQKPIRGVVMLVLYNNVDYWSMTIGINIQKEIFMWITTVTYDLAAIRAMDDTERTSMLTSIGQKKEELKAIDGAGTSTTEYPAPDDVNTISLDETTKIVKRVWSLESSAQAFVDHFVGFSGVTATLEEQV